MKRLIFGVLCLFPLAVFSQAEKFSEPLKIPMVLTGSFAEPRVNHLHSGIDLRTEGRIGLPVYPAADGYVSRIVVSATGFGNALYIDHPNGRTTVYGHLQRFSPEIEKYVRDIQYRDEEFSLDVKLAPGMLPVSKQKIAAYSGDSGNSGGPHLHFEIRDTKTEETINPLLYNLDVLDTIAPKITGLRIYPVGETSSVVKLHQKKGFETVFSNGKYHIKNNPVTSVYGRIGFGIQVNDYLNGGQAKCGITRMNVKMDGVDVYSFRIDRFSFDDTRCINSLIDYEGFITDQKRFYKTCREPGNYLGIFGNLAGDGTCLIEDLKLHFIEIEVYDTYGNSSVLEFSVKGETAAVVSTPSKGVQKFQYNRENIFEADGVKLTCPEKSFYSDFNFDFSKEKTSLTSLFSPVYQIHERTTPIHNPVSLSIKTDGLPEVLYEKALMVMVDKRTGIRSSVGGSYLNGYVTASIRAFGNFAIAVDTTAPVIIPLSIKDKKTLSEVSQLRFRITDNLSGVKNYRGAIDGKWVLFEYDGKNNLIAYRFDSSRMIFKKSHNLKLEVWDAKNNRAVYEAIFNK
jgi:hypothetical protein